MTPGRDVQSIIYIHLLALFLFLVACIEATSEILERNIDQLANSFLQKALFYFKMYLYYKTTDERGQL